MAVTAGSPTAVLPAETARATPLWALELEHVPESLHFVRDHFGPMALDPATWRLEVGGAVERPLSLSLDDLQACPACTRSVVLECAGHRRIEHDPPAPGVAWDVGAVAEAAWTGVSLRAVLREAGISPRACEVVLAGADRGPVPGRSGAEAFARALPLDKACDGDTLLAWAMNGAPLSDRRGGPVRAIVPGWYATDSVKWLVRIDVTEGGFDGYFEAEDYRFSDPGTTGPGDRMTAVPLHALITAPAPNEMLPSGVHELRGIAWGGCRRVERVEVAIDDGPWCPAALGKSAGPHARTFWSALWRATPGTHTLAVRAHDHAGCQPDRPGTNSGGYANNCVHRLGVLVS